MNKFQSSSVGKIINRYFHIFDQVNTSDDVVRKQSQLNPVLPEKEDDYGDLRSFSPYQLLNAAYNVMYENIDTNKGKRLKTYRQMATYPEISDAFDEISDSLLNTDENGDFIHLRFSKFVNLKDDIKDALGKEFTKFVALFDFRQNFYSYSQEFLTDGELAFENIINPNKLHLGIVGVRQILNEAYEFLREKNKTDNIGLLFDPTKMTNDFSDTTKAVFGKIQMPNFYNSTFAGGNNSDIGKSVPLPWTQVTYINTGNFNPERTYVFSILEKIRKVYIQLAMMEDAAIVYRLARSPTRLMFNIATGKLSKAQAEQELMKLMTRFQTRKGSSIGANGQIYNRYDGQTALESYFFLKPEGTEGSTVTKLDGSCNFGEMGDVDYFVKKLYIGLKVPFSRVNKPDTQMLRESKAISYEEYRFAKFLIRLQNAFSSGLMQSFKTHLILTGYWEKFKLKDRDIFIEFQQPANYELYQEQELVAIKAGNYNAFERQEEFSREQLMRKYLKYSDEDIKTNRNGILSEAIFKKAIELRVGRIPEDVGGSLGSGISDIGGGLETPSVTAQMPSPDNAPGEVAQKVGTVGTPTVEVPITPAETPPPTVTI